MNDAATSVLASLSQIEGLTLRVDEPLAAHTALRTGGPCAGFAVAHDLETLAAAVIAVCRKESMRLTLLGAGTRTVVKDGGIPGVVLRLGTGFVGWSCEEALWQVGAATPLPALVSATVRAGCGGVVDFGAVPGSLGASLIHDEGWEPWVESVQVLRRGSAVSVDYAKVRGRSSAVVVGACLRLPNEEEDVVRGRLRDALGGGSPIPPGSWYAPTGSEPVRDIFRSVRLDMVRLRAVAIPSAAPESMINLGGGTAADLALLAKSASDRIKKVRGDVVTPRIRWLGTA